MSCARRAEHGGFTDPLVRSSGVFRRTSCCCPSRQARRSECGFTRMRRERSFQLLTPPTLTLMDYSTSSCSQLTRNEDTRNATLRYVRKENACCEEWLRVLM